MLQAPSDNIFVEIKAKYEDEIHFESGVKLYVDPSFNPNFHATSEGVVHSVPVVCKYWNSTIPQIIQPGDDVLFSYKTVGDVSFNENTELFRMITKAEGYMTEWMNQERQTIHMEKGMKDNQWSAVYTDKYGRLIAGKVGSHGEVENWVASNFKFATGEGFTYDNRCYYKDKELWRVDYSYVFAIRRDGHMRMVGDYLLVEPIVENLPEIIGTTSLIRPEKDRYVVRENKGWLRCGGKGGMKDGDVIHFDPHLKEKYNIQGNPFYIVKRQYVFGKELTFAGIEPLSQN